MKKLTNRELKALEESWVVEKLVAHLNEKSQLPDWYIEEYPIESVIQKKLGLGDSIPEAIIGNNKNKCRKFVEVTIISRSQEDRAVLSKKRRGVLPNDDKVRVENLKNYSQDTIGQISDALIKKSNKSYEKFTVLKKTDPKGILVIVAHFPDPFHDEEELANFVRNFDKKVLSSLDCGRSFFEEIFLYSYLPIDSTWSWQFSSIASPIVMNQLKLRLDIKNTLLER